MLTFIYIYTYTILIGKERENVKDKHGNEIKRLIVDLNINIHYEVKKRASQKNMSIKRWIEEAIMDKIREEIELGFK